MGGMGGANLADPSNALLATCGGDTVKLFDLTEDSGDPCALSYTPTSGYQVNTIKWNHTNLVVASAGEDKKITLWRKNGQCMGTLPLTDSDAGNISESIQAINFSNKGSRYLCSGGSSHMVRIWDLQRKRCIKRLSGHSDIVTGVMYNCKDEHLASISLKGDIILHNLASGSCATELKDPNGQALRVLDCSKLSRRILVTSGDDGSVHLWDTTGRNPKISWQKLHSAPTVGVCCSPSSDKLIASVGLDKKLYVLDSSSKKSVSCTPHESPFSSLAFRDDGFIIAAGTNSGRVIFYDIRGKPQPLTILRAYSSSEAVTSLCWQRSKPIVVNEHCISNVALLGNSREDSVLMPDPLPALSSSSTSSPSASSTDSSMIASPLRGLNSFSAQEATPFRTQLWTGSSLLKLHAPRGSLNLKDDMEVFSPLVDVQPITPSLGNLWDEKDEVNDKKSTFPSSSVRNPDSHPFSDWRSSSSAVQEDSGAHNISLSNELSSQSIQLPLGHQALSLSRFVPRNVPDPSDASTLPLRGSSIGPCFSSSDPSATLELPLSSSSTSWSSSASSFSSSLLSSSISSMLPQRFSTTVDGCPKLKIAEDGTSSQGTAELAQGSSSFSLQLFQRMLQESLGSLQLSIHEDVRNLHIELLRQFHLQEVEVSGLLSSVMEKLDDLQKEVQTLRRENQQLRMLL